MYNMLYIDVMYCNILSDSEGGWGLDKPLYFILWGGGGKRLIESMRHDITMRTYRDVTMVQKKLHS